MALRRAGRGSCRQGECSAWRGWRKQACTSAQELLLGSRSKVLVSAMTESAVQMLPNQLWMEGGDGVAQNTRLRFVFPGANAPARADRQLPVVSGWQSCGELLGAGPTPTAWAPVSTLSRRVPTAPRIPQRRSPPTAAPEEPELSLACPRITAEF